MRRFAWWTLTLRATGFILINMEQQIVALQLPNPALRIRPVQLMDAETLHDLCWPERSLAAIYQLVTRAMQYARQGRGLGVVVTGEHNLPHAYGQLTIWPQCGEISDLIVAPPLRSQGIGTAIIQYLARAAREMHAPCLEIGAALSNPGAVALYRRLGFIDSHSIMIDLGKGQEQVIYLRIDLSA